MLGTCLVYDNTTDPTGPGGCDPFDKYHYIVVLRQIEFDPRGEDGLLLDISNMDMSVT